MPGMKTVRPGRARVVHVETELGIVNVWVGLHDHIGRRVVSVEVLPSCMAGDPVVLRRGDRLVELKTRKVRSPLHSTNEEPLPPCAVAMGCLCAAHAKGRAAEGPCDADEQCDPEVW